MKDASIAHGPITQIAWVTDDIARTEAFLAAHFGAGPWTRMADVHFGPDDCTLHGEPADFTAHVSLGYAADLQLEIIQPVAGESIYSEFLARSGPGLHHICFVPEDFDLAVEQALLAGVPVVQAGSMAGMMRFAYLSGAEAGVPYIELAELTPGIIDFFESIKAR